MFAALTRRAMNDYGIPTGVERSLKHLKETPACLSTRYVDVVASVITS